MKSSLRFVCLTVISWTLFHLPYSPLKGSKSRDLCTDLCTAACRSAISLYSVSPVFFLTSCVSLTISLFSSCPCHSPKELFLVGLNFRSTDWEMPWRKSIYNKRRTIITHCFWAYIVTLMSLARVTAINLNYMLVN